MKIQSSRFLPSSSSSPLPPRPGPFSTPRAPHRGLSSRCQAATSGGQSGGRIMREVLMREQRMKMDTTDDRQFYDFPRIVKHVDDGFLDQVTQLYRERIPDGAVVLDLMSSWVSHLPQEKRYAKVIGHGMNASELARNKQLSEFFVRNLNTDSSPFAIPDQSVDAVVCCVSVQYLQQPERVFAEIYRVLKPGGVAIFSFSNRMFYSKAIQGWRDTSDYGRVQLVKSYFGAIEGFTEPEVVTRVQIPKEGPGAAGGANPFAALSAKLKELVAAGSSDPLWAVVSYRNVKPIREGA